jgi:hypothetical protein
MRRRNQVIKRSAYGSVAQIVSGVQSRREVREQKRLKISTLLYPRVMARRSPAFRVVVMAQTALTLDGVYIG